MGFRLDEELSKRIHALRFFLIVFVVFIHNTVMDKGVNFADGTKTFAVPVYAATVKALAGAITGVAVPLFFLISGFLLYAKEPRFFENLKKKSRTILLPYTLWTLLVLLFLFAAQSFSFTKPYFANLIVRKFSPADWIGVCIGHFGKFAEGGYPLVYQFWFLRDLFVLNLLFTVIKKGIDAFPAGAFMLFFVLWIGGIPIYIVDAGALFFFALGYYTVKYAVSYKRLDALNISDTALMYAITILASIFFRKKIPAVSAVNITVGILFFIRLSGCLVKKATLYKTLSILEQYAFWIYAAHAITITVLIKLSVKIMPMNGAWLLVHYFGVTALCIFLLAGTGIVFRKMFPKLFSLLTGGR